MRDNASTVLSVLLKGATLTSLQVTALLVIFIILVTITRVMFVDLAKKYITYHNYKCDTNKGHISKVIILNTIVGFIILSSMSSLSTLTGLVGLTFVINYLIKKMKLSREITGMVTTILPIQAFVGLV